MYRANHLPSFNQLLNAQPTTSKSALCKHLKITPQTLARWTKAGTAPRAAMLALFYESDYGYSLINSTAQNGEMYARTRATGLETENAALRLRIAHLLDVGDFGAANEPFADAQPFRQANKR